MRKSAQQRITDTQAAVAQWEAAGLTSDRRTAFMRDALHRLQGGKGLSTKQREWLDVLCAEGPPAPKGDPALLARIDAAIPHLNPRGREAMTSFRGTITRGYELSEKQASFMATLLEEAERVQREGRWQPSPELLAKGVFAAQVIAGRGGMWKGSHPGTVTAANRILSTVGPEGGGAHEEAPDEWCFRKVLDSVGPALREFQSPKFEEGEIVWIVDSVVAANQVVRRGSVALVTGGPIAWFGEVGYPILSEGTATVASGKFLTRNPSKVKS